MNDTFCGFQFKKMLLASLLMMFAGNLSGIINYILAAQILGNNAMAAVNLDAAFISCMFFVGIDCKWHFLSIFF